jgi:peptidoglycan L-alanyl-D-glutamate endopeptidase CwlK
MNLNDRSQRNLLGVHPSLVKVVRRAAEVVDGRDDGLGFVVTEGLRTVMRQSELVKAGASKTMNSKHLTGHAVDLAATVGGDVRWDWPLYASLAGIMKRAAQEVGVAITWGGDWKSFKDGPHFEIDPAVYP